MVDGMLRRTAGKSAGYAGELVVAELNQITCWSSSLLASSASAVFPPT